MTTISHYDVAHTYVPSNQVNLFEELEFYCYLQEKILVVPQARLPPLELFGEVLGPFVPSQPCEVPIWVAQEFDKHGWIRVHELPSWMNQLQETIRAEREGTLLQPLPFHYLLIGKWIVEHLKKHDSSGSESSKYQFLLRDLEELRASKLFGPQSQALKQFLDYNDGFGFGCIDQIELSNKRTMILDTLEILSQFDEGGGS